MNITSRCSYRSALPQLANGMTIAQEKQARKKAIDQIEHHQGKNTDGALLYQEIFQKQVEKEQLTKVMSRHNRTTARMAQVLLPVSDNSKFVVLSSSSLSNNVQKRTTAVSKKINAFFRKNFEIDGKDNK